MPRSESTLTAQSHCTTADSAYTATPEHQARSSHGSHRALAISLVWCTVCIRRRICRLTRTGALTGVDAIEPLTAWARDNAEELLDMMGRAGRAPRRLKGVLVDGWSRALWWEVGQVLPWTDEEVRREELQAAATALFGAGVPALWLDNLLFAGGV